MFTVAGDADDVSEAIEQLKLPVALKPLVVNVDVEVIPFGSTGIVAGVTAEITGATTVRAFAKGTVSPGFVLGVSTITLWTPLRAVAVAVTVTVKVVAVWAVTVAVTPESRLPAAVKNATVLPPEALKPVPTIPMISELVDEPVVKVPTAVIEEMVGPAVMPN